MLLVENRPSGKQDSQNTCSRYHKRFKLVALAQLIVDQRHSANCERDSCAQIDTFDTGVDAVKAAWGDFGG